MVVDIQDELISLFEQAKRRKYEDWCVLENLILCSLVSSTCLFFFLL